MAYEIPQKSLLPVPVGHPWTPRPGDIPEVQTAVQPFSAPLPIRGLGESDGMSTPVKALLIVGGVALIGIVGYALFKSVQTQAEVTRSIAEKEGARGVLGLYAGEAAIGLVRDAAMRRNKRKRSRRRRKSR